MPTAEALDTTGLVIGDTALAELLSVDAHSWRAEVPQLEEHYASIGATLPKTLQRRAAGAREALGRVARMSVSAYILIQTEVGKAHQVSTEIASIDGIVAAEDVTGPYDVIARAEALTVDELGKLVVSRVQMIDGITRTLTCPVVHL